MWLGCILQGANYVAAQWFTPAHDITHHMHCIECLVMYNIRGSLHTGQISHLLLYPSLWLLVPGSSSQFLPLFHLQLGFEIISVQYYLWEMATRVCKLWEPLQYCYLDCSVPLKTM